MREQKRAVVSNKIPTFPPRLAAKCRVEAEPSERRSRIELSRKPEIFILVFHDTSVK